MKNVDRLQKKFQLIVKLSKNIAFPLHLQSKWTHYLVETNSNMKQPEIERGRP